MLSLTLIACCTLIAGLAGFVDAIAGGGGLIVLPCLLLSGLPPHYALSANKFSACLGTASALTSFAASGLVLWPIAFKGLGFSLLGAFLGSSLTLYLSPEKLGIILALLLPVALIVTLWPKAERKTLPENCDIKIWKLSLVCLAIGLYDGFFGPATGSFLIIAFHFILGLGLLKASATAKVLNLASNLASTVTFITAGTMLWLLALPMAIGSICGNLLGTRFAVKRGAEGVRKMLSVSLILLTITLLYKYLGQFFHF
ncbi:MAG: TSUP family transporter [Desulfovibrio sp.]|nr:TSUP family transporter [Desulfovibrio sp.]